MTAKEITSLRFGKFIIHLQSITSQAFILAIVLSIAGGFLDAYSYISRGGVFANAQTANMVLIGISAMNGNWNRVFMYCIPVIAFIIGVIVSEILMKSSSPFLTLNSKSAILIIEIILLLIVGFIPYSIPDNLVIVMLSFITSLQYCAFKKLGNSPYATTMCTGNLRSASMAAYSAIVNKDTFAAKEAVHLFAIILSFIFGTVIGGLMTIKIGAGASWFAALLLSAALFLL